MNRLAWLPLFVLLFASPAFAGTGYQVTSKQGEETITYMVTFGGGKLFDQHTAYDPASKSFVYLRWRRNQKSPEPVGSIWDHETGRTLELYKFPNVEQPLPIIPSMDAMKVCPQTGDPNFTSKAVLAID